MHSVECSRRLGKINIRTIESTKTGEEQTC